MKIEIKYKKSNNSDEYCAISIADKIREIAGFNEVVVVPDDSQQDEIGEIEVVAGGGPNDIAPLYIGCASCPGGGFLMRYHRDRHIEAKRRVLSRLAKEHRLGKEAVRVLRRIPPESLYPYTGECCTVLRQWDNKEE